ncbi:MAG TPA: F-box protein [Firmicutes bacterium]|nr:F-box protein [Bacillota bacterium]
MIPRGTEPRRIFKFLSLRSLTRCSTVCRTERTTVESI